MKPKKYTKPNRAIPSLAGFAILAALTLSAGHCLRELQKRDRELDLAQWQAIERTLADERLTEFIHGRSQMVDERDLRIASPAIVNLAAEKLD